jgi:hypothetical protein
MLLFITLLALVIASVAIVVALGHLATAPENRRPLSDWRMEDVMQSIRHGGAVLAEGRQPVLDEITRNPWTQRAR